jgi:hypothetical protein
LLVVIAVLAVLLYEVFIPTWEYYRLPRSTRLILTKLDQRARPPGGKVPLGAFLRWLKAASTGTADNGIPIYADPVGLSEAGVDVRDMVAVPSVSLPLKSVLHQTIQPLGLGWFVQNGLLVVTCRDAADRAVRDAPKSVRRP